MSTNDRLDPDAFRDFEHAGWEINVSEYEEVFARLTRQATGPLLAAAGLRQGLRLLDVATGPGLVASAAAERGARVVGIDFSAPMVARARELNPTVEFREGDAEALGFADCSFDAVVMNFGMLHLARPERAIAETARVLAPGGRFAFTVWAKPEDAVGFEIVLNAIESCGIPGVKLPQGPPFFRFSDPAECKRTLHEAGFVDVKVTTVPQVWQFNTPDALFDAFFNGGVRVKAILRAQPSHSLEKIRIATREGAKNYMRSGLVELPMPAILVSAIKPT